MIAEREPKTVGAARAPVLNRHVRLRLRRSVLTILAVLVCLPFVIPLLWMVSASLLPENQVTASLALIPYPPQWHNYPDALSFFPALQYLRNTLEIAIPSALGTVISASWTAYGFANLQWRGREQVFLVVLGLMMIPGWVTLVPLYVIFVNIHWINTYLPLVVPCWLGGGSFYIFLFRQFFLRQPAELLDAARMDGANEFRVYLQIVMPMATPAIAVATLFSFVGSWTDFLGPLIYLNDPAKYTLMLGLAAFRDEHMTFLNLLMAASATIIAPIFFSFLFMQRFFREGLQLTGLVG
jgi:multiple sugar transport system permease protein